MKKLLISCLFILAFLSFNAASAQKDTEEDIDIPMAVGIYGGANFNIHSPDFLYGGDSIRSPIPFDENKTSIGINIGAIFNYPFSNIFVLSGRIGYNAMGAKLETDYSLPSDTGTALIDASVPYLEISPVMQFHNLFPIKRLYLLGGLELGIPIAPGYDYERESTALRTIDNNNLEIPDANVRFAAALGAGYMINLTDKIMLSPEVSFRFPFTDVSSANEFESWNVPQLRMGVNLTFSLEKEREEPAPSELEVGFREVNYYDKSGGKHELKKITVEEVQYTELFPLLPYVFTAKNSPFPQADEQELAVEEEKGEFSMNSLQPDAVKINMHTIDIIGKRMSENKDAKLTITGTNDGLEEAEKEELSKKRAEFAKKYLVVNYGISPNRIVTRARDLPEVPSAPTNEEGKEENRRIEFSSNDRDILKPIMIEKERKSIADPNMIEIVPYAVSTDSIKHWDLQISQAGTILKKFNGSGKPEPQRWNIQPDELTASEIPVDYTFSAENVKGLSESESGSVPVEYYSISRKETEDMPDKTISKFSLTVFPFDKAEVSDHDRRIIEENVISAIKYNSTVQIYGYTDRIGEEDYNKKLAMKRAETVRDILKSKVKSAKYEVFGVGEKVKIFDNDSPIGRYLSRTVQIYVITPKE